MDDNAVDKLIFSDKDNYEKDITTDNYSYILHFYSYNSLRNTVSLTYMLLMSFRIFFSPTQAAQLTISAKLITLQVIRVETTSIHLILPSLNIRNNFLATVLQLK